jgi:hypothetical protein
LIQIVENAVAKRLAAQKGPVDANFREPFAGGRHLLGVEIKIPEVFEDLRPLFEGTPYPGIENLDVARMALHARRVVVTVPEKFLNLRRRGIAGRLTGAGCLLRLSGCSPNAPPAYIAGQLVKQIGCVVATLSLEREPRLSERFVLSLEGVEICLVNVFRSRAIDIPVDPIDAREGECRAFTVVAHRRDFLAEDIENEVKALGTAAQRHDPSRQYILAEPRLPELGPCRGQCLVEPVLCARQPFEPANIVFRQTKLVSR